MVRSSGALRLFVRRRTNPLTAERGQLYHPPAMIQRAARSAAQKVFLAVVAAAVLAGCDGRQQGNAASAAPAGKVEPTVASLSPAATDLLVGIGAADHLVAVSNYDARRQEIEGLPRVGDYRTQDWEKLAA